MVIDYTISGEWIRRAWASRWVYGVEMGEENGIPSERIGL